MGSRLVWFPEQGAFTSRILGSAAARTWGGHLGQVPGVVHVLSDDSVAPQHLLLLRYNTHRAHTLTRVGVNLSGSSIRVGLAPREIPPRRGHVSANKAAM